MQVILSIQAGPVLPSMLLRKLGSYNRKNRLYQAFRELGRVERTLFLLRYISDPQIRRSIRAETTRIESCNDFPDWITFRRPHHQERRSGRAGKTGQIRHHAVQCR